MEYFDTHCHLNHQTYDGDREAVLDRAQSVGVGRLLVIGYDLASSRIAVEISRRESPQASPLLAQERANAPESYRCRIFAAIGIHPESGAEWNDEARSALESLYDASRQTVAAYGEIGLDYHWESVPRQEQRAVFEDQIAFAATLRAATLPIIIHCRDAFDDVLAVLRQCAGDAPVVMHCFTGNTANARACLDAGYYLGIGGVATFKKSDGLREAIAYAPVDRLLLETDCPYLAPQRWRGKRNEPAYVTAVAETVSEVKGLPPDEVARITTENAARLFDTADRV